MSSPNTILVDDRDSRIIYNSPENWFKGGVAGEHNETEMGTFTLGATFKGMSRTTSKPLRNSAENVLGTSVAVYGTVPSYTDSPFGQPTIQFTLDNDPPVSVTGTTQTYNQPHHEYYASGSISDGLHNLVITYKNHPKYPANFWLDYITFTVCNYFLGHTRHTLILFLGFLGCHRERVFSSCKH